MLQICTVPAPKPEHMIPSQSRMPVEVLSQALVPVIQVPPEGTVGTPLVVIPQAEPIIILPRLAPRIIKEVPVLLREQECTRGCPGIQPEACLIQEARE